MHIGSALSYTTGQLSSLKPFPPGGEREGRLSWVTGLLGPLGDRWGAV